MNRCPNCFRPLPAGGSGRPGDTCPICNYPLLPGWRSAPSTCIAMAGARATGKSIFIGVLIKQLEQLGERIDMTIDPATESTHRIYTQEYQRPLYEQRGIMDPTPPGHLGESYQREPLIFVLGAATGARRFLVIRDVAGEDLEATERPLDTERLSFFAHADAVLFMFDPLKVGEIKDKLGGLFPPSRQGGDPRTVLASTLRLIANGTPKLAVILSKFDAMQALRSVADEEWSPIMRNAGAAFFRDPGMTAHYDEADGELLHEEVRSLLQRLRAQSLVTTVERAAAGQRLPLRFFAVSALGDPPNGDLLHASGIAPFRCLDPIRWVLPSTGEF